MTLLTNELSIILIHLLKYKCLIYFNLFEYFIEYCESALLKILSNLLYLKCICVYWNFWMLQ